MSADDNAARVASDLSLSRRAALSPYVNKFLVDPVFPTNGIHVINGPPDIGKTTWSFQCFLYPWSKGNPVFGASKSYPCDWAYISMDRNLLDTERTLRRIGLEHWDIPAWSAEEVVVRNMNKKIDAEPTLDSIINQPRFSKCKMFFIEGLQLLLPNVGRGQSLNKAHAMFMLKTRDLAMQHDLTFIFVNHTPKGGEFTHDREGGLGSQGLIGSFGTVLNFGLPPDKDGKPQTMSGPNQTADRAISFMMKNAPPMYLTYTRGENGIFELSVLNQPTRDERDGPRHEVFTTESDHLRILDSYLRSYEGGQELPWRQLQTWGNNGGIPPEVVTKWAVQKVNGGQLVKEGRGYRVTHFN